MTYCYNIYYCTLTLQSGYSPLHYASGRDHIETVKVLLEYGAQVNLANDVSYLCYFMYGIPIKYNVGFIR